jgi:glycosyltransferase involved in cell wall biosynthesis
MRILYIANVQLPSAKAHGVQIMKMCEAFAELGHDVELLVPYRFILVKRSPFEYYGVKRNFRIRKSFSIDLTRLGGIGYVLHAYIFFASAAFLALIRHPDIVYSRDAGAIVSCASIGVRNLVWEVHTLQHNRLARRAAGSARLIVAISAGLANTYREQGGAAPCIVAHDAVDVREFQPASVQVLREKLGLPAQRCIVSYVGKFRTMDALKGTPELIEAAAGAMRKSPNVFLLLVGINPYEFAEIESLVRQSGLQEGSYRLVGHVPRREVADYLMASDILVMNYPDTAHYAHVMSPLKLFEYMAAGRAIITTDLPSVREVVGESEVFFVPPGDAVALTHALLVLASDSALRERLGKTVAAKALEHTWSDRAKRILEAATQ